MAADMEIDDERIINKIIILMECAEKLYVLKSGADKKEYVLELLKKEMGIETYDRYEPIIRSIIDFIISVSRHDIKLKLNNLKKNKCCF
jgi:hypothetical protein